MEHKRTVMMIPKGSWTRILGLLVVLALLSACGGGATTVDTPVTSAAADASGPTADVAATATASGGPIRVGSKNFTEAILLGEMYAQLLEANGFTVERKLNLGATDIAHQSLISKEIDVYPEYTSTGLLEVLKLPKESDRQKTLDTLKREYEQQFKLTWLQPAKFNNTNTFALTKKRAQELGINTYSDLFAKSGDLVLGGPPEFLGREDTKGLQEAYGGFQFKDVKQLDPGLRYQALQDGQVDAVVAFSTDGQIGGFDLQALEDDKNFYPAYQAAPVIRQDVLQANPTIADVLGSVADKLDETTMANLNWMVDGPEKMEHAEVVTKFLTDQGLLK